MRSTPEDSRHTAHSSRTTVAIYIYDEALGAALLFLCDDKNSYQANMWLSQVDTLSSKQTPDARKTRFSLFGFNLTQARAADDELWCVYDPVFDLFLPCEPAA